MQFFVKRILGPFFVLVLILGIFIALVPTIISSNWGRHQTVSFINSMIPGNLEIKHVDLNLSKGQSLHGISLKDPEGNIVFSIDKFSTNASLWDLIFKHSIGFSRIHELNSLISIDQNGQSNLQRALGIDSRKIENAVRPSNITLSHFNLDASSNPLSLKITGSTDQEGALGTLDTIINFGGNIKELNKFKDDPQNFLTSEHSKNVQIHGQIVNFPVELIDHLATLQDPTMNGFFKSLLGNTLTITLDQVPASDEIEFRMNIQSPTTKGNVKGTITNNGIILNEPAIFQIQVLPETVNPYLKNHFVLQTPSQIEIVLSDIFIPSSFFPNNKWASFNINRGVCRERIPCHSSLLLG